MRVSKVLEVAVYAGRIILENGGETYRVEDTVCKICEAFDFHAECFATITGIVTSIKAKNDIPLSLTERISSRTTNLDKIHRVNGLARNAKNYSPDELMLLLQRIDKTKAYPDHVMLIASCLGAAGFTGMFEGSSNDIIGAFVIGGAIYALKNILGKLEVNPYITFSTGGALVSLLAIIFYKLNLIDSIDITTIGSIMLLVPGLAITNAIRDIIAGDIVAGMARGAEALIIAACLALGSGIIISKLLI